MKRLTVMILLVLALFPLAVWASEGPEASHRQAAEELLKVMNVESTTIAAANAVLDIHTKNDPSFANYRDVIQKWMEKYFTWDVMGPRMIDLYVAAFTESELRELTAFYKTPTGQKALTTVPALMQQGAQLGTEISQQHTAELEEMIRARDKELAKAKKP
jgi:hypothetical protein